MVEHSEEKLKDFEKRCKRIVSQEGCCRGVYCRDCVFSISNNGHNLECRDLLDFDYSNTRAITSQKVVEAAEKFLKGNVGFQDGKLVEFED